MTQRLRVEIEHNDPLAVDFMHRQIPSSCRSLYKGNPGLRLRHDLST